MTYRLRLPEKPLGAAKRGMQMGLVGFVVVGLVIGLVARAVTPADDVGGVLFTAVIGMVGGLIGGVFASFIVGMDPTAQFWDLLAYVGAAAGAIVLLAFYLLITRVSSP